MADVAAPRSVACTDDGLSFFAAEAEHIARTCLVLAERFAGGGRLIAVGGSPQAWSDARHVAVEFVHPVIVGKRALPALAVAPEDVPIVARSGDVIVTFEPLIVGGEVFDPGVDDPFVAQELAETTYHLLWELAHVFVEHRHVSTAGAGGAGFLYPFLEPRPLESLEGVVEDVARSVRMKAREVAALREQTLSENAEVIEAAADAIRRGGTVYAFGNGGSATDAMDIVADLRASGRSAADLTADAAILTALANDVGAETIFARQLIAYAQPGDVAVAISTSGGSASIVEALAEARRRGIATVAFVGYGGGRIADERLADHVVVTRSDHIPRIQEAQATAYHRLCRLVKRSGNR